MRAPSSATRAWMSALVRCTSPTRGSGPASRRWREALRGEAETVLLHETLDVPPVEELYLHVGIPLFELPDLAVLPSHERLLHRRDLHVEILIREVEVRSRGLDHAARLVRLENERARLVLPFDAVEIKELRDLEFRLVDETGRLTPTICLENRHFFRHNWNGSSLRGRPITKLRCSGGRPGEP